MSHSQFYCTEVLREEPITLEAGAASLTLVRSLFAAKYFFCARYSGMYDFKKRTFLLSEALPPGGNAVPYAYAIASVYESFPVSTRAQVTTPLSDLSTPRG